MERKQKWQINGLNNSQNLVLYHIPEDGIMYKELSLKVRAKSRSVYAHISHLLSGMEVLNLVEVKKAGNGKAGRFSAEDKIEIAYGGCESIKNSELYIDSDAGIEKIPEEYKAALEIFETAKKQLSVYDIISLIKGNSEEPDVSFLPKAKVELLYMFETLCKAGLLQKWPTKEGNTMKIYYGLSERYSALAGKELPEYGSNFDLSGMEKQIIFSLEEEKDLKEISENTGRNDRASVSRCLNNLKEKGFLDSYEVKSGISHKNMWFLTGEGKKTCSKLKDYYNSGGNTDRKSVEMFLGPTEEERKEIEKLKKEIEETRKRILESI